MSHFEKWREGVEARVNKLSEPKAESHDLFAFYCNSIGDLRIALEVIEKLKSQRIELQQMFVTHPEKDQKYTDLVIDAIVAKHTQRGEEK